MVSCVMDDRARAVLVMQCFLTHLPPSHVLKMSCHVVQKMLSASKASPDLFQFQTRCSVNINFQA